MSDRSALLVSYHFPPMGGSGVQRAVKLVKYLPRYGWQCHVVCAGHRHYPLTDSALAAELPDDVQVDRVLGWEPEAIATWLCTGAATASRVDGRQSGKLERRLCWRLQRWTRWLPIADPHFLWTGAATRAAARRLVRDSIDAVITTSPPHETHRVGLALQRRYRLPWIADLRDPIVDNFADDREDRRAADRRLRLESAIVRCADRVVVTCPELADRLRERYGERYAAKVVVIPNGYDPTDAPSACFIPGELGGDLSRDRQGALASRMREPSPSRADPSLTVGALNDQCMTLTSAARSRRDASPFTLTYVGSFYRGQTIEPILGGVRMLRGCRPDVARRIRLRVVGSLSAGQKIHMRPEDRRFLDVVGYRTHADAVREMADADALVLTTPTVEGGRFCIPAKTYEYLAFGGHVIASVHAGTYLEQLLRRAGGCTRVDNPSPDAWRRAIETTYDQWHDGPPARPNRLSVLSALRRDVQAASLARILEDCVTDARPSPAATRVGVAGA